MKPREAKVGSQEKNTTQLSRDRTSLRYWAFLPPKRARLAYSAELILPEKTTQPQSRAWNPPMLDLCEDKILKDWIGMICRVL